MALSLVWLFSCRLLLVRFLFDGFLHAHTRTPYISTEPIGQCLCPGSQTWGCAMGVLQHAEHGAGEQNHVCT
jgi:hypothetical protein